MSSKQAATILEDMRGLLRGSGHVLTQIQQTHEHGAAAGSQAQREIHEEVRVRDAYSAAGLSLGSAIDHLESMADLLEPASPHPYAPASLARTVLETSARAWWVLDPELTVEQRVARGFTERIDSAREVLRFRMLPEEERAKTRRNLKRLEKDADRIGLVLIKTNAGELVAVDEERPGPTRLIEDLFAEKQEGDRPTDEEEHEGIGRMMYRDLSAIAHGTLYAILSRMETEPDPEDEHMARGFPVVKLGTVIVMMAGTLLGFLKAADRQVFVYGWFGPEERHWPSWRGHAVSRIREYLGGDQGQGPMLSGGAGGERW